VKRYLGCCLAVVSLLVAGAALASYHTYMIEQLYSNADGSVQFVVLHESQGQDGENLLRGHTLKSTQAGVTQTYVFDRDLPGGSCSYYECIPSPTANTRVLIATPGFAALGIVTPDYVIPDGFLPIGGGTLNYADIDPVPYGALPTDGVTAISRSGTMIPNLATNFAGKSASVSLGPPPGVFGNFQGLWWNDPPESERGWGINLNHQGTTIFATWFTYGLDGTSMWLVVSATSTPANPNTFTGNLFTGIGPPFNAFDPTKVVPAPKGTATFTFSDATHASFTYTVTGTPAQTKPITLEQFASPVPSCSFGAQPNFAQATNFQDIWWNAPANSEPGWGINLNHQGDTIFATWFTFGLDGKVLWLVVAAEKQAPNVYSGTLVKPVSGPPFNAVPWSMVSGVTVGDVTLTFTDGNNASFRYRVDNVEQTKPITRQTLTAPGTGTVCQ
jgi:hypothetical protein